LQIAGLSEGYDSSLIRGNPADRSFACLYLKDNRLIATDAVNSAKEFVQSKILIASRTIVDRDKLADKEVELKELVE
jgi:3-phenylpropionate/trans-cinnamate dioxygenase ferredoxin reductase subunit